MCLVLVTASMFRWEGLPDTLERVASENKGAKLDGKQMTSLGADSSCAWQVRTRYHSEYT